MTPARLAAGAAALGCLLAGAAWAAPLCLANASPPVSCPPLLRPKHPHVRITRDGYGVPHLKARTLYDVGYGVGQAQAEDRLFQMEFTRKAATGNLAEVVGRDFLGDDEDTRRQFYSEEERTALFQGLSCDLRAMIQGFVDGVNAFLDAAYADPTLARVPHEFFFLPTVIRLVGNGTIPTGVRYTIVTVGGKEVYKPDPWRVTDVAAITALLAGEFGSGGGRQLRQAALLDYLTAKFAQIGPPPGKTAAEAARDVFEDVRWLDDPKAPTTIPTTGAINPVSHGTTPVPLASALPVPPPLAARAALHFGPVPALAEARPTREAQLDFVQSLPPATVRRGLAAAERMRREAERLNRLFGVFLRWGSNAWLVAPARSATGHALLWGGPQEGFGNPNIDWEAYVTARTMRAGGMFIAGVPGVLIGLTNRFAYTTTSGEIDNSTLYVETLAAPAFPEPQADSATYSFLLDGTYHPMDRRTEVFHFAGEDSTKPPAYAPHGPALGDGPVLFNIFRVNDCDPAHFHGPVIEFDLAASPPRAFTYKTAYWKNETATAEGFLELELDRGFDDFFASVNKVVSLHNFFYADRFGNIAYWSAGARPAFPPGFDDRLPADGTGSQEWGTFPDGARYVPFSRSLLSVNPTQGWLANWNTKPAAGKPYIEEGNSHDEHWGEIYRSDRIAFLLAHNAQMTLADVEAIERDVGTMDNSTDTVRAAAPFLIPYIQQAYANLQAAGSPLVDPTAHPTLGTAVAILGDWLAYLNDLAQIYPNGHYGPTYSPSRGQPGMSIFFQWWYALKLNLWGGGASPNAAFVGTVNFADTTIDGNSYLDETTYNMFLHLLEGPAAGVPQHFTGDYFGGHRDEIIVESLNDAIAALSGTGPLPRMSYGTCSGHADTPGFGDPDPHHWGWQPPVNLDFDCLDSFADPLLALGTQPTSFGKAAEENRSTYMQAVEVGRTLRGENVLPPGESGFIHQLPNGQGQADPHMGDQADLFRTFTYKPMLLR